MSQSRHVVLLERRLLLAAVNDNFADALWISGNEIAISGDLAFATLEKGENKAFHNDDHSVWYLWTAGATGVVTWSTDFDMNWGLSARAFVGNELHALQDVTGSRGWGFSAVEGETYYVRVSTTGAGTPFELQMSLAEKKLPTAPESVSVAVDRFGEVQMTWSDMYANEVGYRVEYYNIYAGWTGQDVAPNVTSARTGAASEYRIQTLGLGADSPWVFYQSDSVRPVPANPRVTEVWESAITIEYDLPVLTSVSVNLYRRLPGEESWTYVAADEGINLRIDKDVEPATSYEYCLRSEYRGVESAASQIVSATTLYPAPVVSAEAGVEKVTLSWTYSYPDAEFVVRRYDGNLWRQLARTSELTFVDADSEAAPYRTYQVYALVNGNTSIAGGAAATLAPPNVEVFGTDSGDEITVNAETREIWMNGLRVESDIHPDQIIRVYAYRGNDHVSIVGEWYGRLLIYGGAGDDTLVGGHQADSIYGGMGNDLLYGQVGDDELGGDAGADTITGGDGSDIVRGGEGDDLFVSGETDDGADIFVGGAGVDTLDYSARSVGLNVSMDGVANDPDGDNVLAGIEVLIGGSGNDTLSGSAGDDTIYGGAGADWIFGGAGNDFLIGQTGSDTLGGGAGHDLLYGSRGWDLLIGGTGRDTLSGGAGIDTLMGGGGADTILAQDGQPDEIEQHALDLLDRDLIDLFI